MLHAKKFLCSLLFFGQCLGSVIGSPVEQKVKSDLKKKSEVLAMVAEINSKFAVEHIDPETLMNWRKDKSKKIILLDVRTKKEREVSIIAGAISREDYEGLSGISPEQPIVCYCTIGYRSAKYCEKLKKKGLNAFNLEGSVLLWAHAGGDFREPSGASTRRVHVYGSKWDLLPRAYQSVR